MNSTIRMRPSALTVVVGLTLLSLVGVRPGPASAAGSWQDADGLVLSGNSKTNCVYPANSLAELRSFEEMTSTTFNCVLMYNNEKPNWATWENVWFFGDRSPDQNFMAWAQAVPGRRFVISQPMVPDDAPPDWRQLGAEGDYNGYASALAHNLVAEGLGSSVIRLGWEANDGADPESALGAGPAQYSEWAAYWRQIVTTMRTVPGAHFLFDWTVNQYWRPVPLQDWYPGNSAVDIIGIDGYDNGVYESGLSAAQRWEVLSGEADGFDAVAAFAAAHGKPLSIPEWGLSPPGAEGGAGDDPTYIEGLASIIKDDDVTYNSYFDRGASSGMLPLQDAPQSLAAYKRYIAPLGRAEVSPSGAG